MIIQTLDTYVNIEEVKLVKSDENYLETSHEIATYLLRRGYELFRDCKISNEDLHNALWLEKRSVYELRTLPKNYYINIRLNLVKEVDSNKNFKEMITNFKELVYLRLRKIFQLLLINPEALISRELLSRLTVEEEVLVRFLSQTLKEWINYVLGITYE